MRYQIDGGKRIKNCPKFFSNPLNGNKLLHLKSKDHMKKLLLFFILFSCSVSAQTICTATANGAWSGAIWSCASGPTCGAIVVIPAGRSVTVTSHADYYSSCAACPASPCTGTCPTQMLVQVSGTISFQTGGGKLSMPCCSGLNVLAPNGRMIPQGSGSSNELNICNVKVWKASDGTVGPGGCFPTPCGSYLPVEFVAFTGELEVKVVYLKWKTATELNNSHYDVEKSSDGVNFTKVTTVRSKALNGSSISLLDYSAIDSELKHPIYYYRLKQVDLDGSFKYTNVISVKIYAAEFSIFPNPNNGTFSIDVPSVSLHEQLSVKIYNAMGQLVHESVESVKNHNITGSRVDVTPTQLLPKGIYLSTISFKGETHQLKLVVQ
ncbi:MAG: T9SS type A sorting domain-containing protein [Sphingobacteriaceae bacterium]|nr:T9SS type A sorting domain-containing protein [Sphingobacteriaceae bacterium]